jgi:hypothetical protein
MRISKQDAGETGPVVKNISLQVETISGKPNGEAHAPKQPPHYKNRVLEELSAAAQAALAAQSEAKRKPQS